MIEALFDIGDYEDLWSSFLVGIDPYGEDHTLASCSSGCQVLSTLEAPFGKDRVVAAVETMLKTHTFQRPTDNLLFSQLYHYLDPVKDREAICATAIRTLQEGRITFAPSDAAGKLKCKVPDTTLSPLLVSDDWVTRRQAAWLAGELRRKTLTKQLKRLADSDPFLDNAYHHPVRESAQMAVLKLEQ